MNRTLTCLLAGLLQLMSSLASAQADPNVRYAQDMVVYFGVMPAEVHDIQPRIPNRRCTGADMGGRARSTS